MTTHHWPPRPGILSRAPMQQRSIVTDRHTERTESNIRAEAYWSGFEAGRQHEATAQAKRQELMERAQKLVDEHRRRTEAAEAKRDELDRAHEARIQAQAQSDHEPPAQSLSHWGIHEVRPGDYKHGPVPTGWRRVTFDIAPSLLSDRGMGRPV